MAPRGHAQSADWQAVIWREPQVRYLLADLSLGGEVRLYREYATAERDPDSREAIRLWDAGARVVNSNEFERRRVTNAFGKDGRVMRVVFRGSNRTITGEEVLLTSDLGFPRGPVRTLIASWTLGRALPVGEVGANTPVLNEALRRWQAGDRLVNTNWFALSGAGGDSNLVYRGTGRAIDPAHLRLNSDLAYPETNVRYFLADMLLGGSREFYHRTAEVAHELGCQEAVTRYDAGVKVINLDQFERKNVNGKVLITRQGGDERISGMVVRLSTDLP